MNAHELFPHDCFFGYDRTTDILRREADSHLAANPRLRVDIIKGVGASIIISFLFFVRKGESTHADIFTSNEFESGLDANRDNRSTSNYE